MADVSLQTKSAQANGEGFVTFPMGEFTREFTGTAQQRLDDVACRLTSIAAMAFLMKNSDQVDRMTASALCGIEEAVLDCLRIAELRPISATEQ